jgi:hypothetical protein
MGLGAYLGEIRGSWECIAGGLGALAAGGILGIQAVRWPKDG